MSGLVDLGASGLARLVTEVTPAGPFWEVEPEYQDHLERYPHGHNGGHYVRPN